MATYDSLTQEAKDTLALVDKWARGALVALKTFDDDVDMDVKLQFWDDNATSILASLDAGEVVPQASGHAGAKDLTPAELNAIKAWLDTDIHQKMIDNLALVVKSIGINA